MRQKIKINSKGVSYISWILTVMMAVALVTLMIYWTRSQVETTTRSTVREVSGRMECADIRISANIENCELKKIENKGLRNIKYIRIIIDEKDLDEIGPINVQAGNETDIIFKEKIEFIFKEKIELMPIIEVGEELFACTDKRLIEVCEND